ncbi:hypothetical protein [Streptosporangium sp. KLBMP 9127]|nr:hypothetical protein [Streptosporangium sp. KLBMP 9127]
MSHEMVHVSTGEDGAEEWACPACGRRLLLRWPPRYERVVLDPGDESVPHAGARGDVGIAAMEVSQFPGPSQAEREWLRGNGMEWDQAS